MSNQTPVHHSTALGRSIAIASISTALALTAGALTPAPSFAADIALSGVLLENTVPVAGADVRLYKEDKSSHQWNAADIDPSTTSATGEWIVNADLADGSYALHYELADTNVLYASDQFSDGDLTLSDEIEPLFTVSDGVASSTILSQTLHRNAGAVKMTLRDAVTGELITGTAENMAGDVVASVTDGFDFDGNELPYAIETQYGADVSGEVVVRGVVAGNYATTTAASSSATTAYSPEYGHPVAVTVGTTTDLGDIAMYPYGTPSVTDLLPEGWSADIDGELRVGSRLTVASDTADVDLSYQWWTKDGAVAGANAQTYTPTAADLSNSLYAVVDVRKTGYSSVRVETAHTKRITPGAPTAGTVTIAGIPQAGMVLTANASTDRPATISYQWFRNGSAIIGADDNEYRLTQADRGTAIYTTAVAGVQGHIEGTITSAPVRIATTDANQITATVIGKASFGGTLKAITSRSLSGAVSYQWLRNERAINGADGSRYKISAKDVGEFVSVQVTATVQGSADASYGTAHLLVSKDDVKLKATTGRTIKTSTKPTVRITAKAGKSGLSATSTVRVYYTATKYVSAKITSGKTKTITMPKFARGTMVVKVVYQSNPNYLSETIKLKVHVTR